MEATWAILKPTGAVWGGLGEVWRALGPVKPYVKGVKGGVKVEAWRIGEALLKTKSSKVSSSRLYVLPVWMHPAAAD